MTEEQRSRRSVLLILSVVLVASLMDGLDGSIVNVALPTLASDFNTDTGTIAWVAVTYFVMMAGLLLFFARVAKNGAIKHVLFFGFVIFTVGSLFCGISNGFPMLIVFRIIQGIGAAMMAAAVPIVCVRFIPAANLGVGLGVLTLGASLGFALGPALGGIITEYLSWHWIFLINVPLGLAVIALLLKVLPKDPAYERGHLDLLGAGLLFIVILAGVVALERASHPGSTAMVAAAALVFVIGLPLFVMVELRKEEPILNVRVFKHWRFDSVFTAFLLVNLIYMGLLYLMPFYMEVCMGFSSATSGMYLFIPPLITLVLCMPISRWSDRTERRSFSVISCVILGLACVMMTFFFGNSSMIALFITLILMGLTWAFCGGPMGSRIVENVADESREIGSSLMNETVYLGGTIGTALFAMLFTMGSGSGGLDFSIMPAEVFMDGFVYTMAFGIVLSVIAVILSFAVKEPRSKNAGS